MGDKEFMFGKKKRSDSMSAAQIKALDKKELLHVIMRDPETYKEIRLGGHGALNIINGEIQIVCEGVTVFACPVSDVKAGELMSHNGIVFKGNDRTSGEFRTVTAFYAVKLG